jgi:REP element-mobilizing transposase RayT
MSHRKHLRLKEFDYSSSYYYFVTICTDYRKRLFVKRVSEKYSGNDVVRTSSPLEITQQEVENTNEVEKILLDFPVYYNNLIVDFYVFMHDHIHIILGFEGEVILRPPLSQPTTSRHYTLGDIVGIFKQIATKRLHKLNNIKSNIFQPNYYEHIIRDEKSLDRIRHYILNNPLIEYYRIPWRMIDPNI